MPATATAPRAALYNLGPADDVPVGEGRAFDVAGHAVAVFRTRDGALFAIQARCPHREGPLADGITGAGIVVCPLHGFKFELATGAPVGNACAALRTYPVSRSEAGDVLLRIEDQEP